MKFLIPFIFISLPILSNTSNFNITLNELREEIKDFKPEYRDIILGEHERFLTLLEPLILNREVDLRVVDRENLLSSDFIPSGMVNLSDYGLHTRFKVMEFASYGIDDFVSMSEEALSEGIDIFIASTYRTYKFQDQIYKNMTRVHGEEKASQIVAYPGASQHQLGTAVDFGSITHAFANTDAGRWLKLNAWKFGFTLSYPSDLVEETGYIWEPWHFRYIGREAALLEREFFNSRQHYLLIFLKKYREFFLKNHVQQD